MQEREAAGADILWRYQALLAARSPSDGVLHSRSDPIELTNQRRAEFTATPTAKGGAGVAP